MPVDPTRFRDFVTNEETRVRRFAEKLLAEGRRRSGRDLVDLADQLKLLGEEGLRKQ